VNRRILGRLAASAFLASTGVAWTQDNGGALGNTTLEGDNLGAPLRRYLDLPGTKSYLVHAGPGGALGQLAYHSDRFLFTASAYKTFVLGQYLRDVETGVLSEDEQVAIDDSVRMFSSPVFFELGGMTQARSVLDAMIAYSDNTATDLATGKVGADRVRALLAQLGLSSIRIPDSTRRFFSYLLGAPEGVDLGWPGIRDAAEHPPDALRQPLNDVITLAGSARDFVSWYEQALQGAVFSKPATLREFKRIQAGSVQIPLAVPPDTPAYAKGGEFAALPGFTLNTKSFAGQMIINNGEEQVPVTFGFVVNWNGPSEDFTAVEAAFFAAVQGILTTIKQALQ
jgi:beta-lactamase class A